ncbi:MAG: hypothetical protein HC919_14940 [Oscillatoriales cyanobacterium SM2_2_1]|nr:hypothetical protein [Oscillatoriales cyanobacterium SM2_2_1]
MTTHFIALEIDLSELQTQNDVIAKVAEQLQPYGHPLRWAITRVDRDRQQATVEAVVTRPAAQL